MIMKCERSHLEFPCYLNASIGLRNLLQTHAHARVQHPAPLGNLHWDGLSLVMVHGVYSVDHLCLM
jgi:hypothetical protein